MQPSLLQNATMWNSLNWRRQRSSARCTFTTFLLREHFFAIAVSYEKLDTDAINRIKEAFEILNAPIRASPIPTRCPIRPTRDAFRGATERRTGRMFGLDTWITLYNSVASTMRRNNNEEERYIHFIYAVLTTINWRCIYQRDQGTLKRKNNSDIYRKRTISSFYHCQWKETLT